MVATAARCYLSCRTCGRKCNGTAMGRCTHSMDCCGVIRAHVPTQDTMWVRSGMEGGYLTGPSKTEPRPGAHDPGGERDTPGALSPSDRDPMMVPSTPDVPGASTQRSHP